MESGTEGPGGPKKLEPKPKPVWIQKYFPPGEIERIKRKSSLDLNEPLRTRQTEVKAVIDEAIHTLSRSGRPKRKLRDLSYDLGVLLDPTLPEDLRTVYSKNTEALDWLDREFRLNFGPLKASPPKR